MVKLITRAGRNTGRYLALATLTMTLAACGGGGSDSADPDDVDGDGIPNSEDFDNDADGIDDINDPFVDLDGDGIDDLDFDLDGLPDSIDSDADGDEITDFLDPFVDLDGDGLDDLTGEPEQPVAMFIPVSADNVCGSEGGSDNASESADWDDNCWVRINNGISEGQFANSLYTVGVQRVVYCAGFGDGDRYTDFADGLFGPLTEAAVIEFQDSVSIVADGEVGGQTWGRLQEAITLLGEGDFVNDPEGSGSLRLESYGFTEGRCAGIPLFYQTVTSDLDVNSDPASGVLIEGGWRLARNEPNESESTLFSISDTLELIE